MNQVFAGAVLIAGLLAQAAPAAAQVRPAENCHDCPAPKVYDSQEVVRTSRDVDHSRVIETQSELPVSRRVKENNHLVIRENETRNVGVIQHNHTIIERERRYVRRVPVVTTVSFVVHRYRVVETPATVTVPVSYRPVSRCAKRTRLGGYVGYDSSCRRVLRVRG